MKESGPVDLWALLTALIQEKATITNNRVDDVSIKYKVMESGSVDLWALLSAFKPGKNSIKV